MAVALALVLIILMTLGSNTSSCPVQRCSAQGPEIRFPFSTDQQPPRCGYPGYKLSCKGNYTMLQLPSFGEVAVYSIDYSLMEITIFDPKNCTENLLLHFDPSATPFQYEYSQNYTYINCSTVVSSDKNFFPVHCFSTSINNIYIVYSGLQLTSLPTISCKVIKTVPLPIFLGYIDDYYDYYDCQGFQTPDDCLKLIPLQWMMPGCGFNCLSCGFKSSHGGRAKYQEILGICVGVPFVLVVAAILIAYYFRKRNSNNDNMNQLDIEMFLKEYSSLRPKRYSYTEIKKITKKFKVKLGEGAYGTVFRGSLSTGHLVAVKVLKGGPSFEEAYFMNEVATIGRIHHVNIVRLLGFCADGSKRALIYEFMPNKSLEKLIVSFSVHNHCLNWRKILDIATGISRGIDYLHQGCSQRILHFDIKPHNVLLDQNLIPKISDFGLAKLCNKEHSAVSISAARGTIGYIAPEVLSRNFGDVSHKSDVYSFGIMLLEMVGGRKSMKDVMEADGQPCVPEWIYDPSIQRETIIPIVSDEDENITRKLAAVALWCIQWYPVDRPSMKFVVQMLEGSMQSLKMPPNPFAYISSDSSPPNFDGSNLPVTSEDEVNEIQIEE